MARSIWTGSISFGLVNIPVKVFSTIREHDVHFHQLGPDGARVHNQRVSEQSFVFDRDELARLAPHSTRMEHVRGIIKAKKTAKRTTKRSRKAGARRSA
jgi:hypothetical protein